VQTGGPVILWHRYTATASRDENKEVVYLITRRGWFGFGTPEHRQARWDGYWKSKDNRPDFFYLAQDRTKSEVRARLGARAACIKAHKVFHNMLPAPWSTVPPAKLLPP
jgi:hypothetical protein